jgi:hypothetical protein
MTQFFMFLGRKFQTVFFFSIACAIVGGCSSTNISNIKTDDIGRLYCVPGSYDKSNTSGRYYAPSVDKCVEGKVFQKDHELCLRGPYNTGQFDLAINYNPTVNQCVVGIVIPLTSGICLVWEGKDIVAREYFLNYQSCKDGKVVSKRPL